MKVRKIVEGDIKVGLELIWKDDYNSCEYSKDSYRTIMSIDNRNKKAFFDDGLWNYFEVIISDLYMIEEDKPTGIPTFDGDIPQGTKLDSGKLKPTLLLDDMPLAINEILKVLQFGAEKYSEGNWLKVPNGINRYRNAADRHRLAIDELDGESGMMHLAHEATSVLMLLELKLREKRDAE